MHSRIFQVSESPIKEECLTDESCYDEWDHAEYVCQVEDDKNIIADLEGFQTATKGIKVDTEARTITITSKKEYFEEVTQQRIFTNVLCEGFPFTGELALHA